MSGNLRDFSDRPARRDRDPAGKAALFSAAAVETTGVSPPPDTSDPVDLGASRAARALGIARFRPHPPDLGTVVIECHECDKQTPINYVEFALAQFPFAIWLPPLPGIRYNRRMTCPACHEWSWVRAHWLAH